jgi:uncharacterized membrane protein YgdD (TMEM256/DUF423 family)
VISGIILHLFPNSKPVIWSGWLFIAGLVLFSGSLYVKTMFGIGFGLSTPLGGVCFIIGWILLSMVSLKGS